MENSAFSHKIQKEISEYMLQSFDSDITEQQVVKFSKGSNSALYINGQLDTWGSDEEVQARVDSIFGIYTLHSDDFMLGGEDMPAPTLEHIQDYQEDRLDALTKAKELIDEATSLLET